MVGTTNANLRVSRGYQDAIIITDIPKSSPPAAVPASEHIHATTKFSNSSAVYKNDSPGYAIVQILAPHFARAARQYGLPTIPKPRREDERVVLQRVNFEKKLRREPCEHCIDNICNNIGFRCGERYQLDVVPEDDEQKRVPRVCKYNLSSPNVAVLVKEKKIDECINFLAERNYKRTAIFRTLEEAKKGYNTIKMDKSIRFSVLVCDAEQSAGLFDYFHNRNVVPDKIILMKAKKEQLPNIPSYFKEMCEVINYEDMHNVRKS